MNHTDCASNILLISDFNVSGLSGYLRNSSSNDDLDVRVAPYGQVMQLLLDVENSIWSEEVYDAIVIWTRPENISESFGLMLNQQEVSLNDAIADIHTFTAAVKSIQHRARKILLPSWVLPKDRVGHGLNDFKPGGAARMLLEFNTLLAQEFDGFPNYVILDTSRWIASVNTAPFDRKLWYYTKTYFSNSVLKIAASDISASILAMNGDSRKLIVLDLDNTLWGGIVGDDGWEMLSLGGHDSIGEAFLDFQRSLKALKDRGIMLAIVSKNNEQIALEAIDKHPEMILKREDFVGWRINWDDKAQNILDLVSELNIGLQSVVFIDDNPVERGRVRETIRDVLVPDWPETPYFYTQALSELNCFKISNTSSEDLNRTKMMNQEALRQKSKGGANSFDSWLDSLRMICQIEPLSPSNFTRIHQLLNKTNQFNLTTRRLTEKELREWEFLSENKMLGIRVLDRYGDYGLVGILGISIVGDQLQITDFILSCRVMGRNVERVMISLAVNEAARVGVEKVVLRYLPTSKNSPILEFLNKSNLKSSLSQQEYSWTLKHGPYEFPKSIKLVEG